MIMELNESSFFILVCKTSSSLPVISKQLMVMTKADMVHKHFLQ